MYVASLLLGGYLLVQPSAVAQEPAPAPQNAPSPAPSSPAPAPALQGEITGTVKSGTFPLPGVTVTAANTLTGKKYTTSTDPDGSFRIEVGGKGRYVVRAEFSAFAPVTQEVLINQEGPKGKADLAMILLSRAQREAQQAQAQGPSRPASGGMGGMQRLALAGSAMEGATAANPDTPSLANSGLPNAGLAAEGATESVAVSGAMGRNEQQAFDPGEMQDRMAEFRDQAGRGGGNFPGGNSPGIMALAMGSGPGGFGNGGRGFRNFNADKPHGSIFYNFGGSALDAKPFSLTGQPEDKASYEQQRFGITMGGPLNIPHIYHGGTKTFLFGSYTGVRGDNPYDVFSTVPTLAERAGDFSQLTSPIINPATHTPFANNILQGINPASAAALAFFPLPNLPGAGKNFHFVSSNGSASDTAFLRINHSFGSEPAGRFGARGRARQQRQQQQNGEKSKEKPRWSHSVNGGFSYNGIRNDLLNPFPGLGGQQDSHNYNGNAGYSAVRGLFLNSLRFNYNRGQTNTVNNFTGRDNISAQLGIQGASQSPADFGLPNLSFVSGLTGLQDTSPVLRTTQNYTLSDSMNLTHGKHGWTWGGDYRHQLIDLSNASNARGTFVFTGAATGLDLADFLLGLPQQTSLQFGADNYHFRDNAYDLFVQDNWRASKSFTFNLGLRYEYVSPYTELNNRLVNLDTAPGVSAVAPVMPGQTGPVTGAKYPDGLIRPDRDNFAPRIGVAWKAAAKTVVRAGYGINYNLGQYGQMVNQLAFQPPFAVTETNFSTPGSPLTLQNGFPSANTQATSNHVTNNYGIDPNYRLPYVQTWNLNIQQEAKPDMVINIGYTGSKGTRLDMVRAPDQGANGLPVLPTCAPFTAPSAFCAQPFLLESSQGSSIFHAGSLRVRKRLRHGLFLGGTYTYSKSIDNASSIGGGAQVVAQNDLDLAAERGLSSFDQRQRFTADYYYELPLGKEKKWLTGNDGWAKAFGGLGFSGNVTLASGFPFSPRILGGAGDLQRGVNGALRPDLVAGQSIQSGDPSIQEWFNTAAFTRPAGPFGDAGRNIITGPGTVDVDMAFSKTIQVREMQSLELRMAATNAFNTVHFSSIDTVLGSRTFGQVVGAGSMRKAQFTMRYRF